MAGFKHLVECHCFLKIFNEKEKIINHKFPVFSKLDEDKNIIPKLVKCNNCESLHYVYDICKSELKPGKEDIETVILKDDLILMLPDKIVSILLKYRADLADFEHALDVIEDERWGEYIVIKRSIINEEEQVKILQIESENRIKILNKEIKTIFLSKDA